MKTNRCLFNPLVIVLFLLPLFSDALQAETTECTVINTLPYVINIQGIYCLKGDLATNMTSGNAVTVNTNNVVIDLNGHKLGGQAAGPNTFANGIYAYQRLNITVRNGTVRGFRTGVALDGGDFTLSQGHLVEGIRADVNTVGGITVVGRGNIIRNNQVVDTGGGNYGAKGILIYGPGNRVINNDVYETVGKTGSYGYDSAGIDIWYGDGSVVENNRIGNSVLSSDSCGVDIYDSANVLVANNRITTMANGIDYRGGSTGKYRGNLTSGVTTPFTGGTDAGDNN